MYIKRFYYFLFILFILDICFSFTQHLSMPFDGDVAGGIVPAADVKPILADPFGISVVSKNAIYPNPNRFFAHWTFYTYFNSAPIVLQKIVQPVESVYLAAAISKIIIQISLIFLIAFYITGKTKLFSRKFVLACVLITPLIQINGYESYMGIIDKSITYSFFYALPCVILLGFYLPFFRTTFNEIEFSSNKLKITLLAFLSVFLSLNGPLNPGIILTISLLIFIKIIFGNRRKYSFSIRIKENLTSFPKAYLLLITFISLMSLYSLFIGLNNSVLLENSISIANRYARLPIGLYYVLTQKIGFPVLIILLFLNVFLLKKHINIQENKKVLNLFKWFGLFALIYLLLLPLGGYKVYRPNIIRFDTFMPVTIGMILLYGHSTFVILQNASIQRKRWYIPVIIIFSFIFTFADKPEYDQNKCQKSALNTISKAKSKFVTLNNDCFIFSWEKITDYKDSKVNAELLKKWNITKSIVLYKQQ